MAQGTPVQGGGLGVGDITSFKKMNIFFNDRYFKKARLYKGVDNNKGMGNTDVVGEIKEVNNTKMVDKAKVRKVTIVGCVGGDHCGRLTTPW